MVCHYGMSDMGLAIYSQQGEFKHSEASAAAIDAEVEKILKVNYDKVVELLRVNRDKLDTLAGKLLEKETMYAGEIYELLGITPRQEHSFS